MKPSIIIIIILTLTWALFYSCLMEYIGMVAYLVGSAEERERCNTYLGWLLGQRGDSKETAKAVDITGRSDVDLVACPQSYIGCARPHASHSPPFALPSSTVHRTPHRIARVLVLVLTSFSLGIITTRARMQL